MKKWYILLIIVMISTVTALLPDPTLCSDFEDTTDDYDNDIIGTEQVGSMQYVSGGVSGKSIRCDGTNWVSYPDNQTNWQIGTNDFTYCFWGKSDGDNSDRAFLTRFNFDNPDYLLDWDWRLDYTTGGASMAIGYSTDGGLGGLNWVDSNMFFTQQNTSFSFYCYVRRSNQVYFYENVTEESNTAFGDSIFYNSGETTNLCRQFDGAIARGYFDLLYFDNNIGLNVSQLSEFYNNTKDLNYDCDDLINGPTPEPETIVYKTSCFGDSITFGDGLSTSDTFCYKLNQTEDFNTSMDATNGFTSVNLTLNLDRVVDKGNNRTLILIGTNDMFPAYGISQEDTYNNLINITQSIKFDNHTPYLMSIPPCDYNGLPCTSTNQTAVEEINYAVKLASHNESVCFIDLYNDVFDGAYNASHFGASGIHPTAAKHTDMNNTIYNNITGGCSPFDCDLYPSECNVTFTEVDTEPPISTFYSQVPSDLNTKNGMNGVSINYTITDISGVDNETVTINITVTGNIWINATLSNIINHPLTYTQATGEMYDFRTFNLTDNLIYPANYNLNPEFTRQGYTLNSTLTLSTQGVRQEFVNFNCSKDQTLYEFMFINVTSDTSTLQHYYCNSSYTTGSYTTSEYCSLFHQENLDENYNHTHTDYVKHKVSEVLINDDNTIGTTGCTNTSYIISRCIGADCRYFYYPNESRTNSFGTTNNNGNTWSYQPYTLVSHFHQINEVESLQYFTSQCDLLGNCGSSATRIDYYNTTLFPPSPVNILNPVNSTYNLSIKISFTESFGSGGIPIYGYNITYIREETTEEIFITEINTTTYVWDISGLANDDYRIIVTAVDQNLFTESSTSEIFTISNPITLSEELLQEIADNTAETNVLLGITNTILNSLLEVLEMLGYFIVYVVVLCLGIIYHKRMILLLSTAIGSLLGLYTVLNFPDSTSLGFVQTGLGLVMIIVNSIFFIRIYKIKDKDEE